MAEALRILRVALRNVGVMLGVGLPMLLLMALLVGWRLAAAEGRAVWSSRSFGDLFPSMLFMYAIWVVPAAVIAAAHQLVLLVLPRSWPAILVRLIIVGTALAIAGAIALYAGDIPLAVALLPAAAAYGLLVQPLRLGSSK